MRIAGGMAAVKRRLKISDLHAKDDDLPAIKALFSETTFNAATWLSTLSKDESEQYLQSLERSRGMANHVNCTIERLSTYMTLKAWRTLFVLTENTHHVLMLKTSCFHDRNMETRPKMRHFSPNVACSKTLGPWSNNIIPECFGRLRSTASRPDLTQRRNTSSH